MQFDNFRPDEAELLLLDTDSDTIEVAEIQKVVGVIGIEFAAR
jgi:hypothetical protein